MDALDFSDAKEVRFEPLPRGTYNCTVFEAEMSETGGSGKLGVQPMLRLTFKTTDDNPEEYRDRNIWHQLVVPPKELNGQPYEHYNRMMGNLLGFFKAIGYEEAAIKKWKKLPPVDDYTGRECAVVVRFVPEDEENGYPAKNEVSTVKPAGSAPASASKGLASL
jgi:hypothetical protein